MAKTKPPRPDASVLRHHGRSAAEDSLGREWTRYWISEDSPGRAWTRYWIRPDREKPQREKPQRGLFARFLLLYRMTSRTARMLRVIYYAILAFWSLALSYAISDALSYPLGYIGWDVVWLVVFAVPTVAVGFAAAAVDARARRSRAAAASDSVSHSAKPPADRIPTRFERDEPGIEASKPQAASGAASADASEDWGCTDPDEVGSLEREILIREAPKRFRK